MDRQYNEITTSLRENWNNTHVLELYKNNGNEREKRKSLNFNERDKKRNVGIYAANCNCVICFNVVAFKNFETINGKRKICF